MRIAALPNGTVLLEGVTPGDLSLVVDVLGRHARHTGCRRAARAKARLVAATAAPVRASAIVAGLAPVLPLPTEEDRHAVGVLDLASGDESP